MTDTSPQKRVEGRVMHEFKHGKLRSGPHGEGGKVRSRKQAIAIALSEAGASRSKAGDENKQSPSRTGSKEAKRRTGPKERKKPGADTVLQLRALAARRGVARRSRMTKQQLKTALGLA
jgi:hypothetical protein